MTEAAQPAPEAANVPALNIPPEAVAQRAAIDKAKQAEAPPKAAPEAKPAESETSAEPEAKPEDADKKPKVNRYADLHARHQQLKYESASKDQEISKLRSEIEELRKLPWDQMTADQQTAAQLKHTIKADRLETAEQDKEMIEARAAQARFQAIEEKATEARARIPDFDTAWQSMLQNPLSTIGAEFIAESEKGAEVAYYLGKNPAEAHRIAKLDPIKQGIEFARIEGRLSAPQVRKVSQAPAPAKTLGGANSAGAKSLDEMGMSEFAPALIKAIGGRPR